MERYIRLLAEVVQDAMNFAAMVVPRPGPYHRRSTIGPDAAISASRFRLLR